MKEKPKYNMWQCIGYMVKMAWKHGKSVLWMSLLVLPLLVALSRLLQLFIAPQILAQIEQKKSLADLIVTIVSFSIGLFVLNGLKEYVNSNIESGLVDVRCAVLEEMNVKSCTTSFPNVHDMEIKEMMNNALRTTSNSNEATEKIWDSLEMLIGSGICFAVYLVLLTNLHPVLVAVVLVTGIVSFVVSKRVNEWEYRHREERGEIYNGIWYVQLKAQSVELAKDIRIFGLRTWLMEIYEKNLRLLENFVIRREKNHILANVLDVVLSFLRNGIAYVYLIAIALQGDLGAAEFLLFFTAISEFSARVTGILKGVNELQKECTDLSYVLEYLNIEEPFCFEGGIEIPNAESYELTLENVSFKYPQSEEYILRNVNLTIKAGEKLAIVGLNGAGKTTMVKLLCGFYDPNEGKVLLNGIDIREFNRQEYYEKFSAVFQEYKLLDVTVKENVAQDIENIDDKKVEDCLEKAGLLGFVRTLPEGIDSHVGRNVFLDGTLFSGGQTQRLILARALYKNAPILLLDEPTAALDPIAENDIYMKYNEMTKGRTSIFISHRLASTRFCDRILFLQDGVIAEEGTHEQLLAKGGEYATLFEVQSRYYQEGGDFYE